MKYMVLYHFEIQFVKKYICDPSLNYIYYLNDLTQKYFFNKLNFK